MSFIKVGSDIYGMQRCGCHIKLWWIDKIQCVQCVCLTLSVGRERCRRFTEVYSANNVSAVCHLHIVWCSHTCACLQNNIRRDGAFVCGPPESVHSHGTFNMPPSQYPRVRPLPPRRRRPVPCSPDAITDMMRIYLRP